jgi:hypothetical protein
MRFPSINDVSAELRNINKHQLEPDDADEGIDVRLQVYPDSQWSVHSGSSDYDQDHRGYWGSSSVPGNNRRFDSKDVARDLIEQAREHKATGGDVDEAPKAGRVAAKRQVVDDKEVPIANPEDCDHGERYSRMSLYQFQFGAYADTKVYVWAGSFDDAEEIAIEWADDNARGIFVTLTEDDLKEAAEDLGIEWDEAWSDGGAVGRKEFGETWTPFDDRNYDKIVQHAEADLIVIGWTTLKSGTHVISHEVHAHEVTDTDEIEEVAERSQEDEEEEVEAPRTTVAAKDDEPPVIRISYSRVTWGDSGDSDDYEEDHGWINEDGVEFEPDDGDVEDGMTESESIVNQAAAFLKKEGATQPSSSEFHKGIWYSTESETIDYGTGEEEERSFHLEGFSSEEEAEIYKQTTQRRR